MSQVYVPGPVQIYTGTGTAAAWEFLGWSEQGVNFREMASFRDVRSDVSGPEMPLDVQYFGGQAYVSGSFSRYNESTMQKVLKRRVGSGVTAGAIESNGLGAMMVAQGYAFPLCIYCPYSTLAFQSGSIVAGWNFPSAWLSDEFNVDLSVLYKSPRLIFRAIYTWNAVAGSALLYTNTIPTAITNGSLLS